MRQSIKILLAIALTTGTLARAQERPPQSKTVPDSINFIRMSIAKDLTHLADAMPEEKWNFKPTQGAFADARTFAEQVKHVACANEAWAAQIMKEKQPERCDHGGPSPAKSKAEITAYLRDSFFTNGPGHRLHQCQQFAGVGERRVLGRQPVVGCNRGCLAHLRPLRTAGRVPPHE